MFGYASAYAVTNIKEDIACFVEMMEYPDKYLDYFLSSFSEYPPNMENLICFYAYADVYLKKAKILRKFGFISTDVETRFQYFLINLSYIFSHIFEQGINPFLEAAKQASTKLKLDLEIRFKKNIENYLYLAEKVLEKIKPEWINANKEGIDYNDAKERIMHKPWQESWNLFLADPSVFDTFQLWPAYLNYGFIGRSVSSFEKDLEGFVRYIRFFKFPPDIDLFSMHMSFFVMPYLNVYKKKITILYKYAFFFKGQYERLIAAIEHLEKSTTKYILDEGIKIFKEKIRQNISQQVPGGEFKGTYLIDYQRFEQWADSMTS